MRKPGSLTEQAALAQLSQLCIHLTQCTEEDLLENLGAPAWRSSVRPVSFLLASHLHLRMLLCSREALQHTGSFFGDSKSWYFLKDFPTCLKALCKPLPEVEAFCWEKARPSGSSSSSEDSS